MVVNQGIASDPIVDEELDALKDEMLGDRFDNIMSLACCRTNEQERSYRNGLQMGILSTIRTLKVNRKEKK